MKKRKKHDRKNLNAKKKKRDVLRKKLKRRDLRSSSVRRRRKPVLQLSKPKKNDLPN